MSPPRCCQVGDLLIFCWIQLIRYFPFCLIPPPPSLLVLVVFVAPALCVAGEIPGVSVCQDVHGTRRRIYGRSGPQIPARCRRPFVVRIWLCIFCSVYVVDYSPPPPTTVRDASGGCSHCGPPPPSEYSPNSGGAGATATSGTSVTTSRLDNLTDWDLCSGISSSGQRSLQSNACGGVRLKVTETEG